MDSKKLQKKKLTFKNNIYITLIIMATLFMGIGHAAISAISLDINGLVTAIPQDGIFITSADYIGSSHANLANSKVLSIHQTNLISSIELEKEKDAYITYEITVYNSTDVTYYFNKTNVLEDEVTYSNDNIKFEISEIEHGDILTPKSYKTFKITFRYLDGNNINDSILKSYINFDFEIFYNIDYIGIDSSNYPSKIVKGGELNIVLYGIDSLNLFIQSSSKQLVLGEDYMYDELSGILKISNINEDITISYLNDFTEDYYVLEYISSNGSQYIDTGVVGKTGLKSDITLSFNNLTGTNSDDFGILGARTYSGSSNMSGYDRIYLLHYYNGFAHGYGSYYNSSVRLSNNKKYTVHTELNSGNQFTSVDDNIVTSTNRTDEYNIGLNLYLFAINQDNNTEYSSSINLYHCQIYDGDVLIRDFVPVLRKIDGKVGLYDIVNNKFYVNQGDGEFTYSNVGYEIIDYIESSGTQFIDTGVNAQTGIKSEISLSINNFNSTDFGILGARTNDTRLYLLHYFQGFTLGYGNYYSSNQTLNLDTKYNVYTELNQNSQILKQDNTNIVTKQISETYDLNMNLYLFAINQNNSPSYYSNIKLYNCKIYLGDELIRHFIPVIRESDNEVGLLDLVNNQFYVNSGTASFNYN